MEVCFTGTREGMTDEQLKQVGELLAIAKPDRVRHGCAVGADRQFHALAEPGTRDLYPSNPEQSRWALANVVKGDNVCAELPPLVRNKEMVDQSTLIIATPRSAVEELRSGTWHTIRYARREQKRRTHIKIVVLAPLAQRSDT